MPSLRTKLAITLTAVLLIEFVSTSVLNFVVTKRSLRLNAMSETLPLISDSVYSEIQSGLIQPIHNSSLMAQDTFLKDWVIGGEKNHAEIVRYLRTIKEKYGYFTAFLVSRQTGNYYYYDGILKKIGREDAHDVWFYAFEESGEDYVLDVDTDEASGGTLTVFINHRVEDYEGRFLGVAGIGLKMENLGETLLSFQQRFGRVIYLVDSSGVIQVHPDKSLIETTNIANEDWFGANADAILRGPKGTSSHEMDRGGNHLFVSTRYFPDFKWFLVVEQEESKGLAPARRTLLSNLLVGLCATCLVLVASLWAVNRFQRQLEVLATTDGLTKLYNRRHFLELSKREIASALRYRYSVSLLLVDADHFKRINDTHGHEVGDSVLLSVAEALKAELREVDILGRLGGEEFVVLLPRTDGANALQAAERLREAVERREFPTSAGMLRCTISVGVATSNSDTVDVEDLLRRADLAMYRAKELGRNRVCADGGSASS